MRVNFKCKNCGRVLRDAFVIYIGDGRWMCTDCGSEDVLAVLTVADSSSGKDEIDVAEDSVICSYCQRKQFPQPGDDFECGGCIHNGGVYNPIALYASYKSDNFLGVRCIARRVE